jgi:hypothetical protein
MLAVCTTVLFFACNQADLMVNLETPVEYPSIVHKVDLNSAGYGIFRLEGLENNEVYLARVKSNRVAYNANTLSVDVPVERERVVEGSRAPAGTITMPNGETLVVHERQWQVVAPDEEMFNRSIVYSLAEAQVGDTRSFYVDTSPAYPAYELKPATLKKIGQYCKIWVMAENFNGTSGPKTGNMVSQQQIDDLAAKFDKIYPLETRILGYEYGGGPEGSGGVDGDPMIQILVFDIDGDFGAPRGSVTMGYFYPGDEYKRGSTYPYSTEAEIFYLDSEMMNISPDAV